MVPQHMTLQVLRLLTLQALQLQVIQLLTLQGLGLHHVHLLGQGRVSGDGT